MKLSPKEEWCLRYVSRGVATAKCAASAAKEDGVNKARYALEWADAPFRTLREKGLIERNGCKHWEAAMHCITQAGRDWLAAQ